MPHENPPFVPGFFVLKAQVNETEVAKYVSFSAQISHSFFINTQNMNRCHLFLFPVCIFVYSHEPFELEFVCRLPVHWMKLNI